MDISSIHYARAEHGLSLLVKALTRVRVPSSATQIARLTFTLNLPWNTGVAVILHVFYTRYCCRLGTSLLFVDQHRDTHHLTLHRRRFSGTFTSGLGELMEFYRLDRGEMLEVKFAGRNTFHMKVLQPDCMRVV
ncbi:hypothetical protein PIB30_087032 [Stylosanthes scabra]|uniref:Uncharacterized protein n=1 Tax=Stylosanthes scabra TaxID=79078 RepID=A0ABU6ZRX7_9FABA|nr:hypothetical protein [Stylosanthes scabra]